MPITYDSIATASLSGQAGITFSSIPNTFTDLRIVLNFQLTSSSVIRMRINGDTAENYATVYFGGDSSATIAGSTISRTALTTTYGTSAGNNGFVTYDIMNYVNDTKFKTILFQNSLVNAIQNYTLKYAGQYKEPQRVQEVRVFCDDTFSEGIITLYGIKGA